MSIIKHIDSMKKPYKTRYMIEKMIQNTKDLEEKRFFIKYYNNKLKKLGIDEVYESVPFEEM